MKFFYLWQMPEPPLLLRITEAGGDEIFANNEWSPTTLIMEYFAGERHDIDSIDEESARERYPKAF